MHDVYGRTIPTAYLPAARAVLECSRCIASLHMQCWNVFGIVVLSSLGSVFHASLPYSWVHIYLLLGGVAVRYASLADHYLLSSETAANKQSAP